ncbi:GDP-fucose protein O-fucosyltransferase 2 [Trichinella spiralis]|uniref:GDP-fucose protein O-fucosyltransferase 2 n=1 Tax=Trichinella spiralis TaxID=6334 RepID=UPI0001EFBC5D|nr:GDP-fucose protein O-fucosyltransferase 2 [Trichinella spiralis]
MRSLFYVFVFYEIRRPAVEETVGLALSDFSIKLGIWRYGTIRSNKLLVCRLISDQALKVAGGGGTDFRTAKLATTGVITWYDNRRDITRHQPTSGTETLVGQKAAEKMMVSLTSIVDD